MTQASLLRAGSRLAAGAALLAICLAAVVLAGCSRGKPWHLKEISGLLPALKFEMTADDGSIVTADDYKGKVVMLYFGYTHCPDVCPTTLAKLALVLSQLGSKADRVRVLFVTVDPSRDTLPVLKEYVHAFDSHFVGLRGTDGQLEALAKRYRVSYEIGPKDPQGNYEVTHSSAIFIFGQDGKARLLATSTSSVPDIAADLKRLVG